MPLSFLAVLSFGAAMTSVASAVDTLVSSRDHSPGNSSRISARDWNISSEYGIYPAPSPFTVSLVFPRNETYKPTQYLPIVFAVSYVDFAWPLGFGISLTIQDVAFETPDLWDGYFTFPNMTGCDDSRGLCEGVSTGVTNGTGSAQFVINWSLALKDVCTEKLGSPPRTHLFTDDVQLRFSTAPHATKPDIEEAVNSCLQTTMTIARHAYCRNCPLVFQDAGRPDLIWTDPKHNGTNPAPPRDDPKPYAKKISDMVSDAMLVKMGCKRGRWQDIKTPCLEKEQKSRGHGGVKDMVNSAIFRVAASVACIFLTAISWMLQTRSTRRVLDNRFYPASRIY